MVGFSSGVIVAIKRGPDRPGAARRAALAAVATPGWRIWTRGTVGRGEDPAQDEATVRPACQAGDFWP